MGAGILVIGLTTPHRWRIFWAWTVLALIGQAAALQLIDAGNKIHYQHYRLGELTTSSLAVLSLLVILVQLTCVSIAVLRRRHVLWSWITSQFSVWQILLISVLFIGSSAALSRSLVFYASELLFASFLQLINLANIILAICVLPEDTIRGIDDWIHRNISTQGNTQARSIQGVDKFDVIAAVWVFLFTAGINYFIYQGFPHIQDEVMYLFQAKYFSMGKILVDAPEVPEAFRLYLVPYRDTKWYSPFPPGWPAVLSIGVKIGLPWLVNPILAGINTLLASFFFKEIFKPLYARLALLLLCTSPWFLYMGMNWMSHTLMLTLMLLAAASLLVVLRTGRIAWIMVCGAATGVLSLVRPMDGLALAVIIFLVLLSELRTKKRPIAIILFIIITIVVGSLVLPYNRAVTGDPFLFPLNDYYQRYFGINTYALGFGADRGLNWAIDPLPGYQPVEAILNAALNIFSINIELFGWAAGSLILVLLGIIAGRWTRLDRWMIISILVLVGLYSLFWFSGGPDFGARYWYLTIIPLIYLSVRGIQRLEERVEPGQRVRVILAVVLLCVLSVLNYLPWRALDKYYHYLDMKPDLASLSKEYLFNNGLILIQGQSHPDYAGAWVWNPIEFRENLPVYAYDENLVLHDQLLNTYQGRMIWIVKGPTLTGDTYQVIAGPLTLDQARDYIP